MPAVDERAAIRRLFERFGFGPRPGELDAATTAGFDRTATTILSTVDDPAAPPPPKLEPEPEPSKDKQARRDAAEQRRRQQTTLTMWWLDRMVATGAPLTERLTWFWHGHFATSAQKVRGPALMLAQNETLRRHGLGDFAVLSKEMTVDAAMLIWLDGQKNTAKAANENLARELMELFTLGIGHYSETDVREAARALTGWKVDRRTGKASLAPRQHDGKAKTVLGHTGPLDAESLVDLLVAQPVSPEFVAQRLWFRMVSSTTPPDDAALDRLVSGYGKGRDVLALLRAIAAEPGFRDQSSKMVKQPVEWAAGLMRALRIRPSALSEEDQTKLLAGLRGMGQVPFLPPSVGGWPAGAAWLTTAASLARLRVAQLLTAHADLSDVDDPDAVGALLGVDAWTGRTAEALHRLESRPAELAAVAASAPEYIVSG